MTGTGSLTILSNKSFSLYYRTVEIEKDSQWDSNPHVKYPQVPNFMGGVEPPEVAQLDTPIEGARLSISPWEIEKSFSKIIYHGLDNTGQLLPCCFLSQRHEHVYLSEDIGLLWTNRRLLTKAIPGSASYTTEHFALPLIQICGSGCGNCTHRGFLRVVMSHMTLTSSLTRTLKKSQIVQALDPRLKDITMGWLA